MTDKFKNLSISDKAAIEAVDTVSGATITSKACKNAVLTALKLYKPDAPVDFTFGSGNKELKPGTYVVPIALRNAGKHETPSNAAAAFPAMGRLTVNEDGTAVLTSDFKSVTVGPITDMAYNVKVYQEDSFQTGVPMVDATVLESIVKPEPMPGAGKKVPTKISFQIPDNNWDGVYMNFTVDAMGPSSPDAWLSIDYSKAAAPGDEKHVPGEAKVNQFGKYTVVVDVTVADGVITNVAIDTKDFISETHKPTNLQKMEQVTNALKSVWNGMAPTRENAEKIFKAIMKKTSPDDVIDTVSGATYSAKAVRDAVMNAFKLEYQDEVINVPTEVKPGVYEVEIGYYSDVVWHSLVETTKTKATLTVNEDKTMSLSFDTKSGTEKEPLYILGFNGVYPNNDRTQKLTMDGCKTVMGLSSNNYSDKFFEKGTQVVNHVEFPLLGALSKEYATNCYLYVPAMNKLNGELSGINFENGKFNVDIFAKIYWDSMKKIGELPEPEVPVLPDGWNQDDNGWFFVKDGAKVTDMWAVDSYGWCYLGSDGYMVTSTWQMDSIGWCYLNADGHLATNVWAIDSYGWCYLDAEGHMVKSAWVEDSYGWCYLNADGYLATNVWAVDSYGWCYLGSDGHMVKSAWQQDSTGWCYLNADGYLATNVWAVDSYDWCYLGSDGHMVKNAWIQDSYGWCYLDDNGYLLRDGYAADSQGQHYLDASGHMAD